MIDRILRVLPNDAERVIEAEVYLQCIYIAAALCFILALRGLSRQETAKLGNVYGIIGMFAAIIGTLLSPLVQGNAMWIFAIVAGIPAIAAVVVSVKIEMTTMPQMVGLLNAFGGLAATLESVALFFSNFDARRQTELISNNNFNFLVFQAIFLLVGAVVGMITFTGSLVACAKLAGYIASKPRIIPMRLLVNVLMLAGMLGLSIVVGIFGLRDLPVGGACLLSLIGLAGIYGVIAVMAIGGADMPVVISILNSGSGWAGVFAGLTLQNTLMTISGAFVGASGIILSYVMCGAMNRSLVNVLVGGFGDSVVSTTQKFEGEATIVENDKVAEWLGKAKSVIIAPGYGMAVSHAQFAVCELTNLLRERGCRVKFGIHPVAGRLPGHMNVLLAEANVPYDLMEAMEDINPEFPETDVAVIIGANDTVNPAAQTTPGFLLYGMPVLEVWKAKQTVVLKRSLNVGYAGVDNPLFGHSNNAMLLGDAKKSLDALVAAVRAFEPVRHVAIDISAGLSAAGKTKVASISSTTIEGSDGATSTVDLPPALLSLGIVKEINGIERRVSMAPSIVKKLRENLQIDVLVERGAGEGAGVSDKLYVDAGATIVSREQLFSDCRVLSKVTSITKEEIDALANPSSQVFICGFMSPNSSEEEVTSLIEHAVKSKITLLSLDVLPRITIAQKMDVLSSMALLAGGRAVLEAFYHYGRNIGQQITAGGKYGQAKVFVIGAGVAGLQAVGEAHRMGAEVRGFDIRLECKEQVESLGGKYLVMDFDENGNDEGGYAKPMSPEFIAKEMELFKAQAAECDVFITTASLPGRRAPRLLKKEHVDLMKDGAVIVDLAAASGGNVEITRPGEVYLYDDRVTVIGFVDLASRMAPQAAELFANNLYNLLEHMGGGKNFSVSLDDTIVRAILVSQDGTKMYPPPPLPKVAAPPIVQRAMKGAAPPSSDKLNKKSENPSIMNHRFMGIFTLGDVITASMIALFTGLFAAFSPATFPPLLFVFMLSCWVGYMLIWNVTSALHTPLMSVSNAISGVVLIGGMLGISDLLHGGFAAPCALNELQFFCFSTGTASRTLNYVAIGVASMNVFGGFSVTQRMLNMFRHSKTK
ncbi:transhydrogenase [Cardiosporidium cionae]|uniref:proton-translocating NAD(P)(+) transhydrogenase n=1 Tax=Cardiosporidium cionae TaxID=476202 RepID=A0ABQ7JBT4_9APIC|nr:transhydrogenase [Cardiosporidium cionae]|eukprot:KAF8821419.1 transhydrogenase [Cardiosporidium cionae]